MIQIIYPKAKSLKVSLKIKTEISKSDILLRKWLQNKLEGVDVFWDGDVIGKRTCLNYFGRVLFFYYFS